MRSADKKPVSLVDGYWNHHDERARPDGAEHTVRVRDRLPATRAQGSTDGKVTLQ